MATHHKIIIGDSRRMVEIPDTSVHLVVTSPPYWQLKDYGNEEQIGFHDSYERYVNNLNLVWNECCRVLHDGCRLCVNIGDQFARSVYYGRYKVIPIRTEITRFCETIGMDYMGAIIWQKVTTTNTTGGATIMGSFPYPRNGILKIDYEFILIFKKQGKPPKVSTEIKELSKLTTAEWSAYFSGHWNIAGERQAKHLAMFPEELPRRLIRMFSFVGDTVLDPFLGSGTTSLAAKNLGRNSIGYEINPAYVSVIKGRLGIRREDVLGDATSEFFTQKDRHVDFMRDFQKLPYRFVDPLRIDKKVDPRKIKFGSKIAHDEESVKPELLGVEEVVSPELLRLKSGQMVRLIGVKENASLRAAAIEFLRSRTNRQKVFLRTDTEKMDSQGNFLAYVYLKNKTFLNAHLIKSGLVSVDDGLEYRLRRKFLRLKTKSAG